MPMKLPITRETTGCAMSSTMSICSRPSSRSSTLTAISRISSSCIAIRFGVKPRWKRALIRSCLGGSWAMNIEVINSSGIAWVSAMQPPRSEEKVRQSRETAWTSAALVTDQKPASSGYSLISSKWTGHFDRISLKIACGGPSCQCSISGMSIASRSIPVSVSGAMRRFLSRSAGGAAAAYWLPGQFGPLCDGLA